MQFWIPDPTSHRDHLAVAVGHHVWATETLLDHCATLPADQLGLGSPGAYGSIIDTLDHLVRSDASYQRRLFGEHRPQRPHPTADLEVLRREMHLQAARWHEVLDRLGAVDVTIPAEPDEDPPYPEVRHASALVLTQALHHGHEHRTNVCSILAEHGQRAPDLSAWEYARVALAKETT